VCTPDDKYKSSIKKDQQAAENKYSKYKKTLTLARPEKDDLARSLSTY
jgi:hypothetical protein